MYVATTNVRINGRTVPIGGSIPENLPAEKINRLLSLGAIRWDAPAQPAPAAAMIPAEEAAETNVSTGKAETGVEEEIGEAVPDEIDALDGIVKTPKEPAGAEKKGKNSGRRSRK